jgi:hypothetical protein
MEAIELWSIGTALAIRTNAEDAKKNRNERKKTIAKKS